MKELHTLQNHHRTGLPSAPCCQYLLPPLPSGLHQVVLVPHILLPFNLI